MGDYNRIAGEMEVPVAQGTVKLGRLTNRVKAKFEDWLEGRARRRAFELKKCGELDEAGYKASMRATVEACAAGTFSWGGDAWVSSLGQVPGIVKLVTLLTESAGKTVPEGEVLSWMTDADSKESLILALREVMAASPNFMEAPDREKADG